MIRTKTTREMTRHPEHAGYCPLMKWNLVGNLERQDAIILGIGKPDQS
jgi:hypothetical protein